MTPEIITHQTAALAITSAETSIPVSGSPSPAQQPAKDLTPLETKIFNVLETALAELPSEINNLIAQYTHHVEVQFSIAVRLLSGRTLAISVYATDKVSDLQQVIFQRSQIPPQRQNLLCAGQQLASTKTLNEYPLKSGDMIYITKGTRG